jgi:hypothetical protein
MQSQSVMLILRFADSGWHVRWRTPNTEAFHAVLEEFKALLDLTERYWDPEAFEKGGWWVAYGALGKVGPLFSNYQAVRDELEREHWQRYEQQRKEARNRAAKPEHRSGNSSAELLIGRASLCSFCEIHPFLCSSSRSSDEQPAYASLRTLLSASEPRGRYFPENVGKCSLNALW